MEPQKKLLMIVNPRAGRSKPRGPLYDAAAAFCDAGYLLSIRRTAAAGDARRIPAFRRWRTRRWWGICLRAAPMTLPPA